MKNVKKFAFVVIASVYIALIGGCVSVLNNAENTQGTEITQTDLTETKEEKTGKKNTATKK